MKKDQRTLVAVINAFPLFLSLDVGQSTLGKMLLPLIQICLPQFVRSWQFFDSSLVDHKLMGNRRGGMVLDVSKPVAKRIRITEKVFLQSDILVSLKK